MENFIHKFGRIDVLVNSAASLSGAGTPLLELGEPPRHQRSSSSKPEDTEGDGPESKTKRLVTIVRGSFSVNFEAPLILSQRAAQMMIRQPPLLNEVQEEGLFGKNESEKNWDLRSERWGKGRLIHITSVHGTSCLPNS